MESGNRISRGEYCRGVLPCILIAIAILGTYYWYFNSRRHKSVYREKFMLGILITPLFTACWQQGMRRCHDLGLSGWWQVMPFFNPICLMFMEGEKGTNKYGPNPIALEETHGTLENAQSIQENNQKTESIEQNMSTTPKDLNSKIEVLERFKGLLDSGAITQEEFDKVKSDILNQISYK